MTVLDCFAYTGGFAAHALVGGARRVVAVDVVPQVARFGLPSNLRANASPSSDCDYVVADAFAFLHEAANRGPRFDMVILDPPSLLRKSRDIGRATGVYIKLNRNALKLVRDGGIFVTASCSTRVSAEDFLQIVRKAAVGAGVELRVFTFNLQPPDHPVDPAFPEGTLPQMRLRSCPAPYLMSVSLRTLSNTATPSPTPSPFGTKLTFSR